MRDGMTREDFAPHLNTTFRLPRGEGAEPLELELIDITGGQTHGQDSYSFSLVFRGGPHFRLGQHIFTLEHDALGTLDIFLVPIAQDAEGFRYEAVFTRPLPRD
jgi:hypothetical protein